MDINQSSLNQYKATKAGIDRSASERTSLSEHSKNIPSLSKAQPHQPMNVKEGQVVKGHIIDQRYNEVRIQLDPGKQIISAKLTGDIPLSIGQEAEFQVTETNSNQLTLKYLPNHELTPANATVLKVLTTANLPITEITKAIVMELLNHRMPVDKQTIQTLMKASYQNPEASSLSLVLMSKNHIPLTKENVNQFLSHQNGTSQMIHDIHAITKYITELVQTDHQGNTLDPSAPYQNAIHQALERNGSLINLLYPEEAPEIFSDGKQFLQSRFSQEERATLSTLLGDDNTGANLPTLQPSESLTTSIAHQLEQILNGSLSNHEQPSALTVGDVLTPNERTALIDSLSTLTVQEELKTQIEKGTLSLKNLLPQLHQAFKTSLSISGDSLKLLHSSEYSKLLERAFLQKWTLTPEQLSKKSPVNELYEKLQEDIAHLSNLTKSNMTGSDPSTELPVKNLGDNLNFMKALNEAYTYLQLPMQLQNQQMHSELFVFTNKKALRESPKQLSVLLHLDTAHLGALNVHIQMNHNKIQAKFTPEDNDVALLIEKNIPLLEVVLKQKGYQINAEVERSYVKPDFINDFIEENTSDVKCQRYTFDIRT